MKTLLSKLHLIQQCVIGLNKDKKTFGFSYVTGEKLLSHIKPLMNEQKLLLQMEVTDIQNTRQDYHTYTPDNKIKTNKHEILTSIKCRFTWWCVETGESLTSEWAANGQNGWDKGAGSAATYAERYFLLKFFHVATDKDELSSPKMLEEAPQLIEEALDLEQLNDLWGALSVANQNELKPKFAEKRKWIEERKRVIAIGVDKATKEQIEKYRLDEAV